MCCILGWQVFAAGWKKIFPWKNVSWQKYFCWQKLVFFRWSYFCSWKPSQEHCSRMWLLLILHHVVSLKFKSSIGINDARSDATTYMNMLLKSWNEIRTVELLPVFSTVFFIVVAEIVFAVAETQPRAAREFMECWAWQADMLLQNRCLPVCWDVLDFLCGYISLEWLGNRVVSVLDLGAEGHGFNHSRDAVG